MDFDFWDDINWAVVFWVVGMPGILAGIGYVYYLWTDWPAKVDKVHYLICPGCRRKLKYRARQAGHRGMCANCHTELQFPAPVRAGARNAWN